MGVQWLQLHVLTAQGLGLIPGQGTRSHMSWLSFIELDKAVVHVIRLASYL